MTVFLLDYLPTLSAVPATIPTVAITGMAGLSAATLSTLLGGRRAILLAQAAASSLFLLHFLLLGAQTGMLMCGLGLIQMAVRVRRQPSRTLGLLYGLTVPAALAVAMLSWQGPMSALSATGFLLATLGRWQTAVGRMRVFFVMATVVGAGHNLLAGSVFGLVSDAMGLGGHCVSLWRAGMFRGLIGRHSPAARGLSAASA
ncbi:YgjV family protein [Azospirillum sp. Sh1]|uniref:YgjV family protein n=1 Tax=Azospirillum sp. Sh1 TaxID=2607285 RepID=UPI00165E0264|nr:YgjV family protein [Azospirillum sp. Sh1]